MFVMEMFRSTVHRFFSFLIKRNLLCSLLCSHASSRVFSSGMFVYVQAGVTIANLH